MITKNLLHRIACNIADWCSDRDPDFLNKIVEKADGKRRTNVSSCIAFYTADDGTEYRVDTYTYIIKVK